MLHFLRKIRAAWKSIRPVTAIVELQPNNKIRIGVLDGFLRRDKTILMDLSDARLVWHILLSHEEGDIELQMLQTGEILTWPGFLTPYFRTKLKTAMQQANRNASS